MRKRLFFTNYVCNNYYSDNTVPAQQALTSHLSNFLPCGEPAAEKQHVKPLCLLLNIKISILQFYFCFISFGSEDQGGSNDGFDPWML